MRNLLRGPPEMLLLQITRNYRARLRMGNRGQTLTLFALTASPFVWKIKLCF